MYQNRVWLNERVLLGSLFIGSWLGVALAPAIPVSGDFQPPERTEQSSQESTLPLATRAYNPPSERQQSSSRDSSSTGVRGCGSGSSVLSLLALAPREHIGKTASTHPIFTWFVPEQDPFEIEFELYQVDSSGNRSKVFEALVESIPGIMTFSLPNREPGLVPGDRYTWQVKINCDEDDLSAFTAARADLQVIEPGNGGLLDLTALSASEAITRAEILPYAENGLWYDAIALASIHSDKPAVKDLQVDLMLDLADLEAAAEESLSSRLPFDQQLRAIAQSE